MTTDLRALHEALAAGDITKAWEVLAQNKPGQLPVEPAAADVQCVDCGGHASRRVVRWGALVALCVSCEYAWRAESTE